MDNGGLRPAVFFLKERTWQYGENDSRERTTMRWLTSLAAVIVLGACASQAPVAPEGSTDTTNGQTGDGNPTAAVSGHGDGDSMAGTADAGKSETPDSDAEGRILSTSDPEFIRIAKTYEKEQRDGQTFYCRREAPLGSRLPVRQCFTEDQLLARIRHEQELRRRLGGPRASPCGSKITGCGN